MGKINVVYITDENYAMPTCVSIISLITNKKKDTALDVYVLVNNVSERNRKAIKENEREKVRINIIEVSEGIYDELAKPLLTKGIHVSASALYKFDLANILAGIDKVLYLDGDVIIQDDLAELFEMDLEDSYVAAVDDMGDKIENEISWLASRIGMQGNHYFNSGVMLLNLKKIREESVDKKLLLYRMTNKNYFMDQDALNYVFEAKRKKLPYKYNFRCPIFDELEFEEWNARFFNSQFKSEEDCIKEQVILHLSDRLKPWNYAIRHFSDIFFEYYNRSLYANEIIILKSPMLEMTRLYKGAYESAVDALNKQKVMNRLRESKMIWRFPREKIPDGSRIVIYGAGDVGTSFMQQIAENHWCSVVLWVDKNYKEKGCMAIHSPQRIRNCVFDYVVVSIADKKAANQVKEFLQNIGISSEQIIMIGA